MKLIFGDEMFPLNGFGRDFIAKFCAQTIGTIICKNVLFLLAGISPYETNTALIPKFIVQFPAGSSTMQIMHYFQEYSSGK